VARKRRSESTSTNLFDAPESATEWIPEGFPESWEPLLKPALESSSFQKLQQFLAVERQTQTVFPKPEEVYTALRLTPPDAVRVVILGQDPYPTPGHAHGLAFSVHPDVRPIPASLRNIFKELHSDLDIAPSPHGDLRHWARQGVLLLNTVLTVRSGSAASHAKQGWEAFTDAVIQSLSSERNQIIFLLWGRPAQKKSPMIDSTRHRILQSAHPSPLSASTGFFGSKPFSKINQQLHEWGIATIDWALPPIETS
jgi:uracil-DNA glycosylase